MNRIDKKRYYKEKTLQELNLADDFLFAKVMSDPIVCKKVLEKILGIQISKITMPENQKIIDLLLESKGIRLDVYVNDAEGTVYNVEMQQGENINLAKRTRYYQGNIDLDMIQKGEDYRKLNKSFIIFICTFDPFNKERHMYTFKNVCLQDTSVILGDETEKIFLSTKGKVNDVDEEMLEFLAYIEHTTEQIAKMAESDLVRVLHKKVTAIKTDQRMEVEYMTLLERDREKIEIGREEGAKKEREKNVRNLMNAGVEIEKIAQAIGISKEEIERIVEEHRQ
ncbi:MAG: Rpn family recombination-promoting nuclease/putative transposase [Cellulosilyticum sp.]|nr:Rpn family recombination-promoting nuclease/putative transposase [Cellulosilyticum sp.]